MSDVEFMAFPRIAAVAEVAWSPQDSREWAEFKARLGINAYWSSKIEWRR
jgi:hexosaminidase